jgi:DNA-binding NarL/FixJ family response regulator
MQWIGISIGLIGLAILVTLLYKIFQNKKSVREPGLSADKAEAFSRNCSVYNLSKRETEVARLILRGWTYKAVADHLFISEKTVDSHMQNIYAKTGVRNKLSLLNLLYS